MRKLITIDLTVQGLLQDTCDPNTIGSAVPMHLELDRFLCRESDMELHDRRATSRTVLTHIPKAHRIESTVCTPIRIVISSIGSMA